MNINLYVNDKLTATATDLSVAEVREEAEAMCDELNASVKDANVDELISRVDYVDADQPSERFTIAHAPTDPDDKLFYIIREMTICI